MPAKKRPPSSPKATGGGGTNFEHAVAAWFMVCLLTDTAPFAEDFGRIVRIEFQSGDAYRPLDDLLLHLDGEGGSRQCALSIKSNRQFTARGAPADFVAALWRIGLDPGETGFRLGQDLGGLMTAPLSRNVAEALHAILRAAKAQDETRSLRTRKGKVQKALLESFACPDDLDKKWSPDSETFRRILRSVICKEFDFETQNSSSLQTALSLCRASLLSGQANEAVLLWNYLYELAAYLCPNEGVLTLEGLIDRVREKFRLRAHPNYERDWHILSQATNSAISAIRDVIGDDFRLAREPEIQKLAVGSSRFVVLHGETGVGKTVLAKWWALQNFRHSRVLWLDAAAFAVSTFNGFEQSLGLHNALPGLFASMPDPAAWFVLDGLDTCYEARHFQNVSQFIRMLPALWRVLLTCQTENWERVKNALESANCVCSWSLLLVPSPGISDEALSRFTNLGPLLQKPRLRSLITRPKFLDSLVRHFDPRTYEKEWVGESDLIAWFWRAEISNTRDGLNRAEIIKKLGTLTGDSLRPDVAADEFSPVEHEHLVGLIRDRICREHNERISVSHDRIGDWARQRVLLGRVDELQQYLAGRSDSPLWLIALRLLGTQLLEQDPDLKEWRRVFEQARTLSNWERAQDALLEAAFFAEQREVLLEKLWPILVENEGKLLRRLLSRFLHAGTLPMPFASQLPVHIAIHLWQARYRIPIDHYWLGLLRVLHIHRQEAIKLAPHHVAVVTGCWLERGPNDGPARGEAAELALAVSREALAWTRRGHFYHERDALVPFFRAGLIAASELPDEVAEFARDAAFRLPWQLAPTRQVTVTVSFGPGSYSGFYPPPWLDGPGDRLDRDFQKAVLDGDTLGNLMRTRPDVAKEVLLAALISPPQEPDPRLSHEPVLADRLCLDDARDYSPAQPFRGPFFSLLLLCPAAVIDVIVRLTNFAAERWSLTPRARFAPAHSVLIMTGEDERLLIGDYDVFVWCRSGLCPNALTSALMALEAWFTAQLSIGAAVDDVAAKLLRDTNNVAIAGVLCAVGRQKQDLLAGALFPLITVVEFHDWELARRLSLDEGAARSGRPYDERGLDEISFILFSSDESFRHRIEPIMARWEERAAEADASPRFKFLVEQIAPRFRVENYRRAEPAGPLSYEVPAALAQRNEERKRALEIHSLPQQFPIYCRNLLDTGQVIPDAQVETFWSALERIAGLENIPDDETGIAQKETSYCAAAAVLLILNRQWLHAHPTRERWLIERVAYCVLNPPPRAQFDDDRDIWGFDWSAYAARVVAVYWFESADTPDIRLLVARLATHRKYKTVEILCGSLAVKRHAYRDRFIKVLNLVCDWAIERKRANRLGIEQETQGVTPWLDREIAAFINDTRPGKTVPWQSLTVESEPPLYWRPNSPRPLRYTFDVELWQAAFRWMPRLRDVNDAEERAWQISFIGDHLDLALKRLVSESQNENSRECFPYQGEEWLLESTGRAILDLETSQEQERFWQLILSAARHGRFWISAFFNAFFTAARNDAKSRAAFSEAWPQMVEWAFDSPLWAYGPARRFTIAEAWHSLLCLGSPTEMLDICGNDFPRWTTFYSRWASDWLVERNSAVLFCGFLEEERAGGLLPDGLRLLNDKVSTASLHHHAEVGDALGKLVVLLLRRRREVILRDQLTLKSIRLLLSRLNEIQHPYALEAETLLGGNE